MKTHFDLLENLLQRGGASPLKEEKKAEVKKTKKQTKQRKLTESDVLYSEVQDLVESAIRQTLKTTILESAQPAETKLVQTEAVENVKLQDDEIYGFMTETIDPIIETAGLSNVVVKAKDKNRIQPVSLPVYEVALTLEAARMGALDMESLEDKAVKESVDPIIDDLGKSAEANVNVADGYPVDPDAKKLTDIVDDKEDPSFNFGELEESVSDEELQDVHQYQKNDADVADLDNKTLPAQDNLYQDEVEVSDESNIPQYEGKPAAQTQGEGNNFAKPMPDTKGVLESKGSVLAKILFNIQESMNLDDTQDAEVEQTADTNIKTYEGEEPIASEGDAARPNDNAEFGADGTADEAIVEQQITIAKYLLGSIFNEYGVKSMKARRALVNEAIHYIFKNGVNNLVPMVSDITTLVVEQNKAADIKGKKTASTIVKETAAVLTPVQEASIEGKSRSYLQALAISTELTRDKSAEPKAGQSMKPKAVLTRGLAEGVDPSEVKKAVGYILRASAIERKRQALRHRIHNFSEDAKVSVINDWQYKDVNISEAAKSIKDEITVRKYVCEASELKKYFHILKEDSPVFKPCLEKTSVPNEILAASVIVTELSCVWGNIKKNYYNGKELVQKKAALNTITEISNGFKNLTKGMKNPEKVKNIIEGFNYRINALAERVDLVLKKKSTKK